MCAVLLLCTHTVSGRSPLSHDARTHCRCTAAGEGRHAHSALCMVCAHTEVVHAVQRGAPTACTHCAQHAGAAMLLVPPRAPSDALSKMLASCSIHYVASLCCVFPNSAHMLRSSSSVSPPHSPLRFRRRRHHSSTLPESCRCFSRDSTHGVLAHADRVAC